MELIFEIISYVFVEIIFEKILATIGTSTKWVIGLGRIPYKPIVQKNHNGFVGLV